MGERRKRKSMWDVEEETKQTSGHNNGNDDDNNNYSGEAKEHHSDHDSRRDLDFSSSQVFTVPKSRDNSGPPSSELNEARRVFKSRQESNDGKEILNGPEHHKHNYRYSLQNDRTDSHRNMRKARSRSRSRSIGSSRDHSRSRSPIRDNYRNQSDKSSRICRDFPAGKCRRGSQCRFIHSKNSNCGNIFKDYNSRDDFSNLDKQLHNKSQNPVPCREFAKGKCRWGDNCRFSHHLASNYVSVDEGSNISKNAKNGSRLDDEENIGIKRENLILQNTDGRELNRNGENVLLLLSGNSSVWNTTDSAPNMTRPDSSNGLNSHLNGAEEQKMAGVLETKVIQSFAEFLRANCKIAPEVTSINNEHGNYTEQDNSGSSKPMQETVIANSEANGNKKADESNADNDEKAMRLFKNSLIEFVKNILKPTWKEGRLSRDVHKTIVKKVVDKVNSTVQADHIPKTREKIDQYLLFSKPKIAKLVQAYVERSPKISS